MAASAPEPAIIGYQFFAPDVGFASFEIAESLVAGKDFKVTTEDGTEFSASEGTILDFINELGSSVESFVVWDFDEELTVDDPMPFIAGVEFAAPSVVDFQIISLAAGEPEPTTGVLLLLAGGACIAGRRGNRLF